MGKGYRRAFFAYPAQPNDLAGTIATAISASQDSHSGVTIQGWPQLDVFGANIGDKVRDGIQQSSVLVADITKPNLNVYYEVGFAIGSARTVAPVLNSSFADATKFVQRDGIFDNIGYRVYENSDELRQILQSLPEHTHQELYAKPLNFQQPLFLLQAYRKTDFLNTIVAAIKGARVFFRSFDPVEIPRLSAVSMIAEISASSGVIIPLLSPHIDDADRHNLRAAFLAGLSHGLNRQTLLLELASRPAEQRPADFRDFVTALDITALGEAVDQFAKNALVATQSLTTTGGRAKTGLQLLSIGASAAENEFRTLAEYFVETSEYLRALRGEVKVVAGRKGAGKTAIFFRVRDNLRAERNAVVVDLKPESHQLSLFRERLMEQVGVGLLDHTISAFWYFLLCAEILLKIKSAYDIRSRYDDRALQRANSIRDLLEKFGIAEAGDFTFRLNKLEEHLLAELGNIEKKGVKLTAEVLTNLIFRGSISEVKDAIISHTKADGVIVLLFDRQRLAYQWNNRI